MPMRPASQASERDSRTATPRTLEVVQEEACRVQVAPESAEYVTTPPSPTAQHLVPADAHVTAWRFTVVPEVRRPHAPPVVCGGAREARVGGRRRQRGRGGSLHPAQGGGDAHD